MTEVKTILKKKTTTERFTTTKHLLAVTPLIQSAQSLREKSGSTLQTRNTAIPQHVWRAPHLSIQLIYLAK